MRIFFGSEDPTIDISSTQKPQAAYPWIKFETVPDAGQWLLYQKFETLIPRISDAAKRSAMA